MSAIVQREQVEAASAAPLLPIGAVAREVGLTARAIRYYEEVGLLRPAVRVKGADRLFDAGDVQRLREIKRLREVIGFSLAEIAELLETDDMRAQLRQRFQGTTESAARARVLREAQELAERRLAIIEGKLAQVAAVRDEEVARLARIRELLAVEGHDVVTEGEGE
jgi:DNA-binding transcriptional MerR regulator